MSLLDSSRGIKFYPELARRTSVNAAIIAQQIFFWQNRAGVGRIHEGKRWIFNTYQQWADQTALTIKEVENAIRLLESMGALVSCQLDKSKRDMTKFYRIDRSHPVFNDPDEPGGTPEEMELLLEGDGTPSGGACLKTKITSENTTKIPLAETGVSAPATADALLNESPKASADERKKKVKLAFPSLEELEAQIDGWYQSWELWKTTTLPRQNKSGEISYAALATILADLLEKQNRYQLSAEAMRHGFSAAIGKGVWNVNYVINTAKGYRA